MIKTYLILSITALLLFTKNSFAQTIQTDKRFPSPKYESIQIDKTLQNIIYNYVYIENLKTNEKKQSLTILQIGKNHSKFLDAYTLKKDSIHKVIDALDSYGAKEINSLLTVSRNTGFKKNIIKNLQNNSITFQGQVHGTEYEYEEKSPNLNWQLVKGDKSILNYKVKKAICNYGGRKWVAWYTEKIPINLGPYVFGNLPGLILELHDDENNFHFSVVGINNSQQEIYKRAEKSIIKTSKKDFFKAERNFHEKPELFINTSVKGVTNFKKIPYNPIEVIN